MKIWVALSILASLALGAAASQDNRNEIQVTPIKFRSIKKGVGIINGNIARAGQFPYIAAIFPGFDSFCGGSLIHSQWILTAGHCVENVNYWVIYLGAQKMLMPKEVNRKAYVSPYSWIHPQYDFPLADIALLRFINPVTFTDSITPIALSNIESTQLLNKEATVSGWGYINDNIQVISPDLRYASLTVTKLDSCNKVYNLTLSDAVLCLQGSNSEATCTGDSGGPLVYQQKDGTLLQIGAASFGPTDFNSQSSCELGAPNGFVNVAHFLPWIEETTGVKFH